MPRQRSPLGLTTLAALVVANMIGAGVFTTSGFALADLGSPWRVLAAWLVGGLIALAGAISYGALARVIPESGGEYRYLAVNVHPAAGFVAGWISLLAGFTGAIAFAALAFADYLAPLLRAQPDQSAAGTSLVATLVIVVAAALHALKLRPGVWLQNAAVALKLVSIIGLCGIAFFSGQWLGLAGQDTRPVPPFSITAFGLSLLWISYSYLGFNAAVYIAGEVPDARIRIPKALVIGAATTIALYLGLNAVFVLVPAYDAVAGRGDVAAAAATALGGDRLAAGVRGLVTLALFTSISAMLMIGPRVYARMARDGLAPRVLRLERATPTAAILLQAVLAVAVVWLADLRQLLSYLGFTLGLSAAAAVASLFVVARRAPEKVRPLPGYPWAPAVFVVFTLLFAGLAATQNPAELVACLVTIASGLVLYTFIRRI